MFVASSTVILIEADSSNTSESYKMFEAVIIACIQAFISQGSCITVVDTYGPYESETKCEARVIEMKPFIRKNMPPYIPIAWRCQAPELHFNPNQKVPL